MRARLPPMTECYGAAVVKEQSVFSFNQCLAERRQVLNSAIRRIRRRRDSSIAAWNVFETMSPEPPPARIKIEKTAAGIVDQDLVEQARRRIAHAGAVRIRRQQPFRRIGRRRVAIFSDQHYGLCAKDERRAGVQGFEHRPVVVFLQGADLQPSAIVGQKVNSAVKIPDDRCRQRRGFVQSENPANAVRRQFFLRQPWPQRILLHDERNAFSGSDNGQFAARQQLNAVVIPALRRGGVFDCLEAICPRPQHGYAAAPRDRDNARTPGLDHPFVLVEIRMG